MNVKKLDKWFARFIRLRDTDKDGVGLCIGCRQPKDFSQLDNGHFFSRRHMSLRWSTKNCNAQCRYCNSFAEDGHERYGEGLERKYGKGTVDILSVMKTKTTKLTQFEIDVLADNYQRLTRQLFETKTERFKNKHKNIVK